MRGEKSEMERLVMAGEGGIPPYFAYQGETKGLRENGLHEGETKELGEKNVQSRKLKVQSGKKREKSS